MAWFCDECAWNTEKWVAKLVLGKIQKRLHSSSNSKDINNTEEVHTVQSVCQHKCFSVWAHNGAHSECLILTIFLLIKWVLFFNHIHIFFLGFSHTVLPCTHFLALKTISCESEVFCRANIYKVLMWAKLCFQLWQQSLSFFQSFSFVYHTVLKYPLLKINFTLSHHSCS